MGWQSLTAFCPVLENGREPDGDRPPCLAFLTCWILAISCYDTPLAGMAATSDNAAFMLENPGKRISPLIPVRCRKAGR